MTIMFFEASNFPEQNKVEEKILLLLLPGKCNLTTGGKKVRKANSILGERKGGRNPTSNSCVQKWKLSPNTYTLHARSSTFWHRFACAVGTRQQKFLHRSSGRRVY